MKNYKIRVLHLSHTDIGYKDIQSKIVTLQSNNLLDVIKQLKNNHNLENKWVWNIECFGTLENFLSTYPEQENDLINFINKGLIGLSANYWNFSKILGKEVLSASFKRVVEFNKKIEIKTTSLIANDINGYARSWAEEASEFGIENLFFGLHTHHGFYPGNKKQYPFWWKLPNGKKSLVWIGEQYAFGNNMGIVPGPMSDYITKDGVTCGEGLEVELKLANKRIQEYIQMLEKTGYQFSIIPISSLGTGSDNDPANYDILERCELLEKEWKKFGVSEVKMVTLEEFFREIREEVSKVDNIPTYEGEWPDWWTDGVGAAPQSLRAFREAQRNYKAIMRMKIDKKYENDIKSIEDDLLLYAEHTFGTEDPIQHAHSQYNFTVEKIKQTFAFNALNKSQFLKEQIQGWKSYRKHNEDKICLVIKNLFDTNVQKTISINQYLGWTEADKISSSNNANFIDENDNLISHSIVVHPHPTNSAWDSKEILLHVNLKANSTKKVFIDLSSLKENVKPITSSFATLTAELADDVENINVEREGIKFINNSLKTDYFTMDFDDSGIKQIIDNVSNKPIICEDFESLFSPVYFVNKIEYDRKQLFLQRRRVGKNKISDFSKRFDGKLKYKTINISEDRKDATVSLYYEIESCKFYEVNIQLSNHHSRIDAEINLNKDTEWSMESLLISLPFKNELELEYDKAYKVSSGQIPGTLVDYHSIHEGMVFGKRVMVNQLDASLVWTGPLTYGERSLAQNLKHDQSKMNTYTWALNNGWETNFPADTSGFHCFRYSIFLDSVNEPKQALDANSSAALIERINWTK